MHGATRLKVLSREYVTHEKNFSEKASPSYKANGEIQAARASIKTVEWLAMPQLQASSAMSLLPV